MYSACFVYLTFLTFCIKRDLHCSIQTREWSGDLKKEMKFFMKTLKKVIQLVPPNDVERLNLLKDFEEDDNLEQRVTMAFDDIKSLLKMNALRVDATLWFSQAEENFNIVIQNSAGTAKTMWTKLSENLKRLDIKQLDYDNPIRSGILDSESEPVNGLTESLHEEFNGKGVKHFLIDEDQELKLLCEEFIREESIRMNTDEAIPPPREVSPGDHRIWSSHKFILFKKLSYMCEVLTPLFTIAMSGLPLNCVTWGEWDKRSLISGLLKGDMRSAERHDYTFVVQIGNTRVEMICSETGRPNSSNQKQRDDHRKLARLSKGDTLKIYAMRKESSLLIYRPITSARIPLQIATAEELYSLKHSLLIFRNSVAYTLHNLSSRIDESNGAILLMRPHQQSTNPK
ncbi:hypothetical protein F8M41_021481 [Gigaspora margarita]|uniref:Uncharacterized protein n=1 Tax=Gigaspora margarita TaxID=4874 RepID=A0A8H4B1J7_GIGMA|nr:hypothetical protein F8M41_021481 [Gigaspora margarita]